jgi:hypothetical protein
MHVLMHLCIRFLPCTLTLTLTLTHNLHTHTLPVTIEQSGELYAPFKGFFHKLLLSSGLYNAVQWTACNAMKCRRRNRIVGETEIGIRIEMGIEITTRVGIGMGSPRASCSPIYWGET